MSTKLTEEVCKKRRNRIVQPFCHDKSRHLPLLRGDYVRVIFILPISYIACGGYICLWQVLSGAVGDDALGVPKNGSDILLLQSEIYLLISYIACGGYICLAASCFTAVGDGAHAELLKMLAFLRIWRPEKRE